MARKLLVFIAWIALGCVAFVTLSPIGLRPVVTDNPAYERFAAYAILGVLFGLTYPRRLWLVIGIVVGAAIVLEGLQNLTPDRHEHLADLLEKASGGLYGALLSCAAVELWLKAKGK